MNRIIQIDDNSLIWSTNFMNFAGGDLRHGRGEAGKFPQTRTVGPCQAWNRHPACFQPVPRIGGSAMRMKKRPPWRAPYLLLVEACWPPETSTALTTISRPACSGRRAQCQCGCKRSAKAGRCPQRRFDPAATQWAYTALCPARLAGIEKFLKCNPGMCSPSRRITPRPRPRPGPGALPHPGLARQ